MFQTGRRRLVATAAIATMNFTAMTTLPAIAQDDVYELRVSVDTNLQTSRTAHLAEYLNEIEKRSDGRLKPTLYHSAQLYADRDVGKALLQGAVEMAMPGSWTLSGIVSDLDFPGLPSFFGVSAEEAREIVDGEVGEIINAELDAKLNSHVIGRWHELEPLHTYSVDKPIESFEDMKGMRIRHPGSAMQSLQISQKGATPVVVPWPDVALALNQGQVDGLVSTHNTVISGKLWDTGVKYTFEDANSRMYQMMLIANPAWEKLPDDLKAIMEDTWEEMLPTFLERVRNSDDRDREVLVENGFTVYQPTPEQLEALHEALAPTEEDAVKELKINPAISEAIIKARGGM
ncbi:TRAP transporter substrate-binding protein DctP [Hoeflea sp. WL0058]|uniref:TRAP transporter substrate-binding protein DctP n=1 Tax=Flavimaribacter sediminis TaxID=2865987 RepID=A0AAE3D2P5_9HYPH|nr:TRAP transporter substrate-binding protein DctP [Flavimaribacter sediminis]MBW8639051.1 TRAP transporter substrate-binding protein DctP [Flavimaribacter sediminis]